MIAYLSSLPQPMTPTRTLAYARVIEATPLNENAWERVALVEAREIINDVEAVPSLYPADPYVSLRDARGVGDSLWRNAIRESLANFLTLNLEDLQ